MLLPLTPTQLIMVSYHRQNDLARCVNSILFNTKEPFRLSIIDNSCGAIDTTLDSFDDKRITVYKNNTNLGKGKAIMTYYNAIMQDNTDRYFVSIDSDLEVPVGWLSDMRRAAGKIPNLAFLAPAIKDQPQNTFAKQLATTLIMHQKDEDSRFIHSDIYENKQTAGPLYLINRGFFESVGGYVQTQLYGNDDGELCVAARKKNLFVGIATNVEVLHLESDVDEGYKNWKTRNVHANVDGRGYWDQ